MVQYGIVEQWRIHQNVFPIQLQLIIIIRIHIFMINRAVLGFPRFPTNFQTKPSSTHLPFSDKPTCQCDISGHHILLMVQYPTISELDEGEIRKNPWYFVYPWAKPQWFPQFFGTFPLHPKKVAEISAFPPRWTATSSCPGEVGWAGTDSAGAWWACGWVACCSHVGWVGGWKNDSR